MHCTEGSRVDYSPFICTNGAPTLVGSQLFPRQEAAALTVAVTAVPAAPLQVQSPGLHCGSRVNSRWTGFGKKVEAKS